MYVWISWRKNRNPWFYRNSIKCAETGHAFLWRQRQCWVVHYARLNLSRILFYSLNEYTFKAIPFCQNKKTCPAKYWAHFSCDKVAIKWKRKRYKDPTSSRLKLQTHQIIHQSWGFNQKLHQIIHKSYYRTIWWVDISIESQSSSCETET